MKLFVLDPIHQDAIAFLRAQNEVEIITSDMPLIAKWIEQADGVIVRGTAVSGASIRAAKKLRAIGRHGAGYDKVDVAAVKEKGIALINTPFENTQSVAELAVALMLAASRNVVQVHAEVKNGDWAHARGKLGGSELSGHPVGFVGFGRIARLVAGILKTAFAMPVLAYDPLIPQDAWAALRGLATPCPDLGELFASCDFISIHVPKTENTKNLIGAELFSKARKSLVLVNTARGGVVDEAALYRALSEGQIRAAASDVFAVEPLDAASPLLRLPNFIATAHYGGSTGDSLRRVALAVARETLACLHGAGDPAYRVA